LGPPGPACGDWSQGRRSLRPRVANTEAGSARFNGATVGDLAGLFASLTADSGHELRQQAEDVGRYALSRASATRDRLVAVLRWTGWVREWKELDGTDDL
jgi:hypothetical protein